MDQRDGSTLLLFQLEMAIAASCSALTRLDINTVDDHLAHQLQPLQQLHADGLRVLGLSGANPRSLHSLRRLTALSKLEQLQMRWNGQLKDAHASFLPHLVALTALDLSYCRNLSGDGLQQLQWLPQLRALNLTAVGSDDLSCLRALQQLTGLTDIASLTQLQALALRRCTITAGGRRTASSSTCSNNSSPGSPQNDCNSSSGDGYGGSAGNGCKKQQLSGAAAAAAAISPSSDGRLHKLDLRLRGSGCSWSLKGLLPLLQQLPGLSAVYVSEVPAGLPACEKGRVIACSNEQAPLPVSRDVGLWV
ncbi:hypothetical protein COO60DRAFT_1636781 [Scenedesmus sp. NREL 46B-D3]|nr:hypothetical protein COO60DRAFT_1636781 [Scenedesmus sp. NREL 46B-D3]